MDQQEPMTLVDDFEPKEEFSQNEFNSGVIPKSELFDLFISYKRDNGEDHGQQLALELYDKLTADGYKVWFDKQEIGFSTDFELRIEQALMHSKKVLCVIGPGWVNSPNCRFEAKKAIEFEKRIIPIHYQAFREQLLAQKKSGALTDHEWRRIDKPQEVDFSHVSRYAQSYLDLKAICDLHDKHYHLHARLLCESYYWSTHHRPKSMLLTDTRLSKAKLVKRKCDADEDYPTFTALQNEFLSASQAFISSEVSNKRKVYLAYSVKNEAYAHELNLELKLHNISTWFDELKANQKQDEKSFIEAIVNCESVLDVVSEDQATELNVKVAFARSSNKRVLKVTDSRMLVDELQQQGEKNIHFWNDQTSIDQLITVINGDKAYNAAHARLLDEAYQWQLSDKKDSKLLSLNEALQKQTWYKKAEKEGSEPQPNTQMVDFVERSVARGQALRKRRKMTRVTSVIGLVLLIGLGSIAFILGQDARQAQEEMDLAVIEKNNAEQLRHLADSMATEANALATIAEAREKQAEYRAQEASEKEKQALNQAIIAERDKAEAVSLANEANVKKAEAEQIAEEARKATEASNRATEVARQQLEVASQGLEVATQKSDSINTITKAKIEANRALEFVQLSQVDSARVAAETAYSLLTESIQASADVQSLYQVYRDLLPDQSVLSLPFNAQERQLDDLNLDLRTKLAQGDNSYPRSVGSFSLKGNDLPVNLGWHRDIQDSMMVKAWLDKNSEIETSSVSALCLDASKTQLAIGYKSGVVEIWDWLQQKRISRFVNHSFRITSVAFNPGSDQLAIASIDERFSLVPLDGTGKRNAASEIIIQENGLRANQIFYWNRQVLITIGWGGVAKAYGTHVAILREELSKETNAKSL